MGLFKKPSAPPAPDYAAAAQAQGAANRETALASWQLNNANQVTPWGSRTVTNAQGQPITGDTGYTVTTTLNPQDQANLNAQRNIESGVLGLAPSLINRATSGLDTMNPSNLPPMAYQVDANGQKRLDFSQLPGAVYDVGSTDAIRKQVEDAAWNKYITRAAPLMENQTNALNTRLANMGGVTTSPAAMRQQAALRASQGDQVNQAIQDMILQGGNAAQQEQGMRLAGANLFNTSRGADAGLLAQQVGQNNQVTQQDIQNAFANANLANASRLQGLNEQAQLAQMPLNQLMAMLSGTQVNSPQFQPVTPTNIQPAPLFQAAQAQNQAAQQQYQNQLASSNSFLGDLASLGAAGITAWSDRRLKSDIVLIGKTPGGLNLYEYTIFGRRERGVMADEVPSEMVIMHPSGYLMVDYSKVK